MTVNVNDTVERYAIDGAGPYAFSFSIFVTSDLTVSAIDDDGIATELTLDTHYSVNEDLDEITLIDDADVTYDGYTLDIRSDVPLSQPTSLSNRGTLSSLQIETALDRLARQIQDLKRLALSSVRAPDTENLPAMSLPRAELRASTYLAFDADGLPTPANELGATTLTRSLIIDRLNDDTSASRTDIGEIVFPILGDEIEYTRTAAEIAAGVVPTDYGVPNHENIGYVLASRYGFATGASGATNYTALVNAHSVAVEAGVGLVTPDGTYTYTPSAAINVAVNWSANNQTVLNVNMSAYSGIVFQQIGSTEIKNIYGQRTGTEQGTFLKQSPVTTTDFSAYQVLDRVWGIGFGVNLDIENFFMGSYNNCRFNDGGTGIRCVPDQNGGDNGYVTTLRFDTCEVRGNDQNHLFTSTLQSRCVKFINCGFETPQVTASTFTRFRELSFDTCYFEGSNTIRGLILDDCSASLTDPYFNGTMGLQLTSNTEVRIKGYRIGSATDVIAGGDGTQIVSLEDCQFPSSGNSLTYLRLVMINTQINGTWYQSDGSIRASSTLTLTGCTTSPTGDADYSIADDDVKVRLPAITGTSNTTAATFTGLAAAARPATQQNVIGISTDNSVNVISIWTIGTDGTITLYNGVSATFTGSGTKGCAACTISFKKSP